MSFAINHMFKSSADVRAYMREQITQMPSDGGQISRVVKEWKEIRQDAPPLRHTYAAVIDRNDRIYNDESKFTIYGKIFFSIFLRPIQFPRVLISHLADIAGVASSVFSNEPDALTASKGAVRTVKLLGYMIAAPVLEVILVVESLAAVILLPLVTPIAPSSVYMSRDIIGRTEIFMLNGKYHHRTSATPCFQGRDALDFVSRFFMTKLEGKLVIENCTNTDYGEFNWENFKQYLHLIEDNTFSKDFCDKFDKLTVDEQNEFKNVVVQRSLINYSRAIIWHFKVNSKKPEDYVYCSRILRPHAD